MAPKIGIGITTYLDITDPAFGMAVFDAYSAVSSKIVPNQIRVWSTKHQVTTRDEFGLHWLTRSNFTTRENRGRGPIIERAESLIGARWRRTGSPSGQGDVQFRPVADATRSSSILIESAHARSVEWHSLFERLIEIFAPSYAMLHLFTEAEKATSVSTDRFEKFDRPFAGEEHFTSWKSSLGEWRSPDPWERAARRQYRHLPELSWANFLGAEFDDQYDAEVIRSTGVHVKAIGSGLAFQITRALGDVERLPDQFNEARTDLRRAFPPGFFRR